MYKNLYTLFFILCLHISLKAQTTILDFESPQTSTVFQYFGSPLDGTTNAVVANPNATGINTSANVSQFTKPAVAEVWAGAFSNPNPVTLIDLVSNSQIKIKVHMDHIGNLALKLEGSADGGNNWVITVPNTKVNEWEELTFDVNLPSIEGPNSAAKGFTYSRVVLFFDFGTGGSGTDVVTYFDDIVIAGDEALPCKSILDFESPEYSTVFQYFGSPLDGTTNEVISNPNPSGINTSDLVSKFIKPAVAEVWAGAFSNPNPGTLIDLVSNSQIKIKVHMDHIGNLTLKLEGSADGGNNWVISVPNTKINEWEELTFDVNLPSIEGPNTPAKGFTYSRVVLFFDFGTGGSGTDVVSYFDDIVLAGCEAQVCKPILDFESAEYSTVFQYFGSPLDGTTNEVIANPNPSGINESEFVSKFIKPGVAEVWAGAFSNPNPTTLIDLVNNSKIRIKVHMDHIGNLALKLEGSPDGGDNWVITVPNTKVNEWEELEFDVNLPSIEGPNKAAKGFTYTRIVLFFDFGIGGNGNEITYYFDDICQVGSSAPQTRNLNFKVDMNSYTSNFDKVYLSGTFNNWSGEANPLSDDDADGIWEGSLELLVGLYEYKVTLDNWNAQENFIGTEECTQTDPSGQFHNRKLIVSGNTDIPKFCFNSCYACGEGVDITFKLGMGTVTPNPEGVWLAGGGNFDVPGGRYRMKDDDGDGIYEITVPRKIGFSSFFTFANGPCADYSCKEIIEGLPCANPNNFNDRLLTAVTQNTVYASCFGLCTDNAECIPNAVNDLVYIKDLYEIWGNPSIGQSTVVFYPGSGDKQLRLVDAFGKLVISQTITKGQHHFEIDTHTFAKGMYEMTVVSEHKVQTSKLIKL